MIFSSADHCFIIAKIYHNMTKIKNLEMAPAVSADSDISISHTFFGLVEKAVYTPTGSSLKALMFEYSADNGERLNSLLQKGAEAMPPCAINDIAVGNIRAEVCYSVDRSFLAVNMLRYCNFKFEPMGCVRFFKGSDAERVSRLFARL